MNKLNSRRIASFLMAMYGALLGFFHGFYELQQGLTQFSIGLIFAKGSPCDPNAASDGCWPALSLIPSARITGILAIIFSVLLIVWATFFPTKKNSGWIQLIICFVMLIFGAGFISVFYGIASSIIILKLNSNLEWWKKEGLGRKILSIIWLWFFILQLLWNAVVSFTKINLINEFLEQMGFILLPIEICILILTIFTSFASDGQKNLT